ncbi:MAG: hypothetical protein ACO3PD_08930, partial [Acidimicrobiales bacterium]
DPWTLRIYLASLSYVIAAGAHQIKAAAIKHHRKTRLIPPPPFTSVGISEALGRIKNSAPKPNNEEHSEHWGT